MWPQGRSCSTMSGAWRATAMDEERRRGTEGDIGVVTLRLWYSEDLLWKERMWRCVWGISLSSSMATVISSLSSPSLMREMKSVSPGLTQAAVMATAESRRPPVVYNTRAGPRAHGLPVVMATASIVTDGNGLVHALTMRKMTKSTRTYIKRPR